MQPDAARHRTGSGNFGEDIAAVHLEQHGFRIITRNFRTRFGEIDLIAENGRYLAFVEVKLRAHNARVSPLEAVTPAKQAKLRAAAEHYLQTVIEQATEPHRRCQPRFDVIAIQTAPNGQVATIQWIENAF